MKKFELSIPKPCHENWDKMTPQDKGRFCGSCQKTVVDFSNMSDRQIAEFFKKPQSSVCGRFHEDQLERPIEVPRKRIPWIKYFFQFTWPAFVLFLKGCGTKEATTGKVKVEQTAAALQTQVEKPILLGTPLPPIEIVDTAKHAVVCQVNPNSNITMGVVAPPPVLMGDTTIVQSQEEDSIKEVVTPLDPVIITYAGSRTVVGAISYSRCTIAGKTIIEEKQSSSKEKLSVSSIIKAFPNPIRANQNLTITLPTDFGIPKQVQLISLSGALIKTEQINSFQEGAVSLTMPSFITPGTYIVRIVFEKDKPQTVKIIIIN